MQDNTIAFIKWICEVPRTPYEILAELEKEGKSISYPGLMQKLGVLVAKMEMRRVKRMDRKVVYQTIPIEIKSQEVSQDDNTDRRSNGISTTAD